MLGLAALGEVVGVRAQQIQKYENGKDRIASSRLFLLAAALGVPVNFFFAGLPKAARSKASSTTLMQRTERSALTQGAHKGYRKGEAMDVELQINNSASPDARFLTWAPSPCRVRMTNPAGATGPTVTVRITGASAASGGAVVFRSGTTGAFANSLTYRCR